MPGRSRTQSMPAASARIGDEPGAEKTRRTDPAGFPSSLLGLAAASMMLLGAIGAPAKAKTLVFCAEGNPETLSPALAITGTAMDASRPMFNNLVEFRPGTTELRPALAESWTISPDGREYVFRLRPGVAFHSSPVFHPSRTMNAADVVFSFERQWKKDHPFHAVGGGEFGYFLDMGMPSLLEDVRALDDRTVRIRLTRPEASFLSDLALPFNAIGSAEYSEAMLRAGSPGRFDAEPIGTGPFRLTDYRKDVTIRYRAFDAYWRGRPEVDTLVFSVTPMPAARLTKLKAGECHVASYPNPSDVAEIEGDPNLRLMKREGFSIGYLALNATRPPFNDKRVRQALNLAIDRQSIFAGSGVVAKNPLPPTSWAYDGAIAPYRYDPAEARRLLVEAGVTGGVKADLWYMPVSRPYNPDGKRMAEMIAADLEKFGIRLELKTAEWNAYREKLQDGEPTMALYGWTGDNGDPDNFLYTLLSCTAARVGGNNIARWCDPRYEDLVAEAKRASDQAARRALYVRAQEIFHDEAPWVPIAHSVFMVGTRKEVRNFVLDPLGYHVFEGVDLRD